MINGSRHLTQYFFTQNIFLFLSQILDEVQRIMRYIRQNSNQPPKGPNRAYIFMEDELFDLTTMAMEYFKENIEPTLPEITYFGADFLDFTTSFASKYIFTRKKKLIFFGLLKIFP